MRILMIGTGYVGLVTGACFAEMGHHVICLDIDKKKIKMLKKGEIPIYEPGLEEIVERNIEAKRISFTTDYEEGVANCDVCFLAVPTPSADDGSCNTSYIAEASREIAKYMSSYKIIVNKSTVPIGTASFVKEIMSQVFNERGVDVEFDIVSNPEFLKEGSAIADCMKPDRVVIGSDSQKALEIMREIYAPFTLNHDRIIEMDILSAEMTKYASNAMLATRISFMNEIAHICKRIDANVNKVRKGMGSDSRIGYSFLYAGVGYGGSCFPKDIRALKHIALSSGYTPRLLTAVDEINNDQKKVLSKSIIDYFSKKGGLKGKTLALWGLAFKPDTDDMREAPSLIIIDQLLREGASIRVYDPVAMENTKEILKNHKGITFCKNEEDAASGAHGIALLTEWKQFRHLDFAPLLKKMNGAVIFDGRNQYHPHEMHEKGFDYIGIGLPDLIAKR